MGMFDLYYEKLKAKMSGQPPMNLQQAMAALKAELQEARQNADQGLNEQVRKRLDYSRKCSDALMDCAAERIRKETAWDTAVESIKKLFERNQRPNPDFKLSGGNGNWMVSLMKTGGTLLDEGYNEKLIAQMALCTGQIRSGEYNFIREMWHKSYNREVPEEANENYGPIIQQEQRNAAAELLDALEEKLRMGEQQWEAAEASVGTIIKLDADDDTLSNAFHIVESDEIRLLENVQTCFDDFEEFEENRKLPEARRKQSQIWPPVEKARMAELREKAEQEAQMYYAAMLEKAAEEVPEEAPQEEPPAGEKKLTQGQKTVLKNKRISEHLKPYGLTWTDMNRKNTGADRIVYGKETGETVILKVTEADAAGGYKIEISDADPGRLVNFDLAERMSIAKSKVKYLEVDTYPDPTTGELKHSAEYDDLCEKMTALEGVKLNDEPSLDQVKDAGNRFRLFGQALEKYIKMRAEHPEPEQRADWYEGAIKELRSFVHDKLDAILLVDNHIRTKNARELDGKELEEAIGAAQAKGKRKRVIGISLPEGYIEAATEWSVYFADRIEQYDTQMKNAWDQAIERAKMDGTKKVTPPEPIALDLFQILEQSNHANKVADRAQLKVLLGATYHDPADPDEAGQAQKNGKQRTTLYDAALAGKVGPEELVDTLAKSVLACEVAKELMKLETQMDVQVEPPIKALIEGGRLYDVVDMVKNSQSFGEHYRALDLSGGVKSQLDAIRNAEPGDEPPAPAVVAKEILKSYLDRQRQQADKPANKADEKQAQLPVEQRKAQPVLKNGDPGLKPPVLK